MCYQQSLRFSALKHLVLEFKLNALTLYKAMLASVHPAITVVTVVILNGALVLAILTMGHTPKSAAACATRAAVGKSKLAQTLTV